MKKTTKTDFALLDAHTHILPDMDDGSDNVEESLELIRLSFEKGVKVICMTPHFYPGNESPEQFLDRRETAIQNLSKALEGKPDVPEIYFGAEVEFFQGISLVEEIDRLCIGQSRILLVEMPFTNWTGRMLDELYVLRDYHGITPMIAHVDRYLDFGNEEFIGQLIDNGILIQANASFFLKGFGSRKAMRMMKKKMIHFIGSDCHNLRSRRPNLYEAAEKILAKCGEEAMDHLTRMQKLIRVRGDAY